ncbi:MAG: N-acetylmuramoyl-L-alanine amidase [PVC group bacterium]|nr:N-acetylmuramoyl-L-alanine amidase [PVC group bacterium]
MKIIFHCSDSIYGNSAIITKWHLDRGFRTIGYHYVILNGLLYKGYYNKYYDGHIETGRPLDDGSVIDATEQGAHTRGHNKTVGICLIGKSGDFTTEQISAAKSLLIQLRTQFGNIEIKQHSNFDFKKPHCAGLDLNVFNIYGVV